VATIREMVLPRRLSTPRLIVVGFLVLMGLVALVARQRTPHYKYPEEEIAIG
jgi:hypothetical protein